MNFVIELLDSRDFNVILMMIDRLIKMHHYVFYIAEKNETFAKKTIKLLINHVWKLHELSNTIMSNRESQFISLVWKTICRMLKINVKLFIAFHSKTDNQSEIVNQKMKRYLRNYYNYQQDDWSKWLSMIEFVFNAAISIFIELSVFMTNYEFESRMNFDSLNTETNDRLSDKKRLLTRKTITIVEKMKNIWDFIKKKLINAQKMQKKHADKHKTFSFEYQFEDMMWLFIKNIKTKRSFRKLNHKWIELYRIKKMIKEVCQLNLSSSMKIHDIFHTSLLRKVAIDLFIEQISSSSSSIVVENEEKKYEINDILNNRYHYEKLQYKIVWTDHSSDRIWYFAENFQKHLKEILIDYHQKYSNKSKSELRLIALIASMIDHFYWLQQAKNLVKNTLNKMQTKMKNNRKIFNKDSFVINVLTREERWISAY
jgi:hypothetical protein